MNQFGAFAVFACFYSAILLVLQIRVFRLFAQLRADIARVPSLVAELVFGQIGDSLARTREHLLSSQDSRPRVAYILVSGGGYLSCMTQRLTKGQRLVVAVTPQRTVPKGALVTVIGEATMRGACAGQEPLSVFTEGGICATLPRDLQVGAQLTLELEAW